MFSTRSEEKEILDMGSEHYTHAEYEACMIKLFTVNRFFGFLYSTQKQLKKFTKNATVVEVGCGSGMSLLRLGLCFPEMTLTGIDISEEAIQLSNKMKKLNNSHNVTFKQQALSTFKSDRYNIDIVLASLVCHHMNNAELIEFLQDAQTIATKAVIINDLHRHPLAYFFYKLISPFFKNKLITHDGLISILRGFTRTELKQVLAQAGIAHYQLTWCFPFRWRLLIWNP